MEKQFVVLFNTDNLISESGQKTITGHIKNMLLDTLYKRTYFYPIIEGRPYTDQYETSDARSFFQCALVCAVKNEWHEALEWYTLGSRCFTDDAVIYNETCDIQCHYNHYTEHYDVMVVAWINTMYGSKQEQIKVGDMVVYDPHVTDMTGHDVIDRVSTLKDEWFALVKKHRDQHTANEAAIAEFNKGLEYK